MLAVAGREKEGWLDRYINNFPCEDLQTIDQLWLHYSKGKFGFSVQKEIYESLTKQRIYVYDHEMWRKFSDHVGWRKGIFRRKWLSYEDYDLTFDLQKAPKAHLPGFLLPQYAKNTTYFLPRRKR